MKIGGGSSAYPEPQIFVGIFGFISHSHSPRSPTRTETEQDGLDESIYGISWTLESGLWGLEGLSLAGELSSDVSPPWAYLGLAACPVAALTAQANSSHNYVSRPAAFRRVPRPNKLAPDMLTGWVLAAMGKQAAATWDVSESLFRQGSSLTVAGARNAFRFALDPSWHLAGAPPLGRG